MKLPFLLLALSLAASLGQAAEAPPQKTELFAENTELWTVENETHVVCTRGPEQVTLIATNLKITCDRLEVIAIGVGDKTGTAPVLEKFKYLLATGNVRIIQGDREATCGRAEVFPQQEKVVLTENPVVIDHGGDVKRVEEVMVNGRPEQRLVVDHSNHIEQTGSRITMLRAERRVFVEKSYLTGPSLRDLGFDPKQPAPAAPTSTSAPPANLPAEKTGDPKSAPKK